MKLRSLCRFLLAAGAAVSFSAPALADYPERTVRLINPYAAGAGAMDVASRLMAEKMSKTLGGTVIVVNQPGAGATLAANATARGAKDGYTVYFGTSSSLGFAKFVRPDLPYDPQRDFTPVAMLGSVPVGFFVSASSDIRTVQDLIKAAKAKPGSLNYGSPGVGTVTHVAVELLEDKAGIEMKHIPYSGNLNYWTDLVGGQLQMVSGGITGGLPLVKDGRLRLIATATSQRSQSLPDVPAVGEVLPGYDAPAWLGLAVAKGTPAPIVAKLEKAALAAFNEPEFKATLAKSGIEVTPLGSKAFEDKVAKDMALWEKTLSNAGLANKR